MRVVLARGVIQRCLFVAYRLDPDVAQGLLPPPLRTRLINGYAVAGIVLARLGRLRPVGLPAVGGLTRESATHGVAVEWESARALHTGVYILHRDRGVPTGDSPAASTSATAVTGLGRRLHRPAQFTVDERTDGLRVAYTSRDRAVQLEIDVSLATSLMGSALFPDVPTAARFFELDGSSDGWRPDVRGLRLTAEDRCLGAAHITTARSSILADASRFPHGSVQLDSALLCRDVAVSWAPAERVRAARRAAAPSLA